MRFYRPLAPIRAMTFDLDDTLYDNRPVMDKTEDAVIDFIRQYDPRFSMLMANDINVFRDQLRITNPEIYHDVSQWRWLSWQTFLLHYGYTPDAAIAGADAVMAHFAKWRSRIDVPALTHDTLARLAQKIPLVAITNGNMEPEACGMADYFSFILKAGPDGRAKPYCDMYHAAARRLQIPENHILHVGDNLNTDVEGAIMSGLQACWINLEHRDLYHDSETRLLPHVEITQLDSLIRLL